MLWYIFLQNAYYLRKDIETLYIVIRVCKVLSLHCSNEQGEKQMYVA